MICKGCRMGADNMDDYRAAAARADDERRQSSGEPPFEAGPARRWIRKRARWALALHCLNGRYGNSGLRQGSPGCTCQCKIPELES